MPFTCVSKYEGRASATKQTPIFLIPGVTGQSAELLHLISYLKQFAFNRSIYVWDDPRLISSNNEQKEEEYSLTILKLSLMISREIRTILNSFETSNDAHYPIIGYSFGGVLSIAVAQQLKKSNLSVAACIIDTPSPATLKKHFNDKEAKKDFFAIMMYANQLSPDFNSLLLYSKIATQNLQNLHQAEFKPEPKLDSLHLILTSQTLDKYKCTDKGNWEQYADHISTALINGAHTAPLEKSNSEFVVNSFLNYLDSIQIRLEKPEENRVPSPTLSPRKSILSISLESDTSPSTSPLSSPPSSPCSGYSSDEEKYLNSPSYNKITSLSEEKLNVEDLKLSEMKPAIHMNNSIKFDSKLFVKARNTRSNTKMQVERLVIQEGRGLGNNRS